DAVVLLWPRHCREHSPYSPRFLRHALMYVGGFERNFPNLSPSTTTFTGTDAKERACQPCPSSADGLRLSYMEKHGKKFLIVRVGDGKSDVVLKKAMVMEPGETFDFGTRH